MKKDQYRNTRFTGLFASFIVPILIVVVTASLYYLKSVMREVVSVSFENDTCLLEGNTFELKWIHSVEKQWWVEAYQIQDGRLLLTDTYFQTFGAGTPSTEYESSIEYRGNTDSIKVSKNTATVVDVDAINNINREARQYQQRQRYLNDIYDGYVHYKINTQLEHLNWMISSNIKAVIINQQTTLPIYQWVDDYTNIHITPKTLSLWTLITQESCHDYTHTTYSSDTATSSGGALL